MTPKCLALCGLVAALSLTSTVSVDKFEQKVKMSQPADECGSNGGVFSRGFGLAGESATWESKHTKEVAKAAAAAGRVLFPMRSWQISINHINPHLTLPAPFPPFPHCLPKSFHFAHLA